MVVLTQPLPSISREFIKWQSNDMINSTNDDFNNSPDKNVSQINRLDRIIYFFYLEYNIT
jgi:hypothetical protein